MVKNHEALLNLSKAKMPFGKYKNYLLVDVPEAYYVWFKNKGFPQGKLGKQMASMYEIKLNGLEEIIRNLKQ